LVRRSADHSLTAIPYKLAYSQELEKVAQGLNQASETVTNETFRQFLVSRARSLLVGDMFDSDALWVRGSQSPIDVVVGPYEVYDDALKGLKTSYEAAVLVRHPFSTQIEAFVQHAAELCQDLPGAVAADPAERNVHVGVFDVEFAAGMLNMGSKAIAATLPNDERVRNEVGARLLLFRNIIEAKFEFILHPLSERLLAADALELVSSRPFSTRRFSTKQGTPSELDSSNRKVNRPILQSSMP